VRIAVARQSQVEVVEILMGENTPSQASVPGSGQQVDGPPHPVGIEALGHNGHG
jgi:hypothetical protein